MRSGISHDSVIDSLFKLISRTLSDGLTKELDLFDIPIETTIFLGFFPAIVCNKTVCLIL